MHPISFYAAVAWGERTSRPPAEKLKRKLTAAPYLCGWRVPPFPWTTWSVRCRAWSRARCPPGPGSGRWCAPGTSRACRGAAPGPPRSGPAAPSAPRCCRWWTRSRGSPPSARSRRTAEKKAGEELKLLGLIFFSQSGPIVVQWVHFQKEIKSVLIRLSYVVSARRTWTVQSFLCFLH